MVAAVGCGGTDDDTSGGESGATDSAASTTTANASTTGADASTSGADASSGEETPTTGSATTGSGGLPACMTLCSNVLMYAMELGCDNLPPDCEETCQTVYDTFPPCQPEWVTLIECQGAATVDDFMCDPMGGMALKGGLCSAEDMAFDACVDML